MIIRDDIALHNVAELDPAPGGGVFLRRYPQVVRGALAPLGRMVAQDAAGVELRFVTDAPHFRLSLGSEPGCLAPYENHGQEAVVLRGPHVHSIHRLEPGRVNQVHVTSLHGPDLLAGADAPGRGRSGFSPRVWRVLLGRYPAIYFGLETYGADRRPPGPDELPARRWLAYGSSITNGASPSLHLNSYVYHAAHLAGLDVFNLGLSGSCQCEPEVAAYLGARTDWAVATLELGVNMRGGFSEVEFRRRVAGVLGAVCSGRARRAVHLLTQFPNCGSPEKKRAGAAFDAILRELHASGEWPGLGLIEGGALLDEESGLSVDLLHPSDYGHARIGSRLAEALALRSPAPA